MKALKTSFLTMSLIIAGTMSTMVYSQTIPPRAAFYNANSTGGTTVNPDGSVIYKITTVEDLFLMANMIDATNLHSFECNRFLYTSNGTKSYAFPVIAANADGYYADYDSLTCKVDSKDVFLLCADIVMPDPYSITPSSFWPWNIWGSVTSLTAYGNYNWFTPAANGGVAVPGTSGETIMLGFQATFDGNGHTISNLYLGRNLWRTSKAFAAKYSLINSANTGASYGGNTCGFIGNNAGTIKNLKLEIMDAGMTLETYGADKISMLTGGISASNGGVIDNCTVTLKGGLSVMSGGRCGGIAAANNNTFYNTAASTTYRCGTIKNCTVNIETAMQKKLPNSSTQPGASGAICCDNSTRTELTGSAQTATGTPLIQNCTVNIKNGGKVGFGIVRDNGCQFRTNTTFTPGVIDGCTVNIEQGGAIAFDSFLSDPNTSPSGIAGRNGGNITNCMVNVRDSVANALVYQNIGQSTTPAIIDGCTVNLENGVVIDAGIGTNTTYGKVTNFTLNLNGSPTVKKCPGIDVNYGLMDNAKANINGYLTSNNAAGMGALANSMWYQGLTSGGSITNSTVNLIGTMETTAANADLGAIVCDASYGVVKNNTVNITGTLKSAGGRVGGLVGYAGFALPNKIDGNKVTLAASGKINAPNSYVSMLLGYASTTTDYVFYSNNTVQDLDASRSNIIGKSGVTKPAYLAAFYGVDDLFYSSTPSNLVAAPAAQYCFDVDAGHTVSSNKDLTGTTGIDNVEMQNLKIYPNPVKDELRIDNGELRINKVEICDLTGKMVNSQWLNGKSINVANLPQGIYFVKIETDKGNVTRKFIKE